MFKAMFKDYVIISITMDKVIKDNKLTTQDVSEPPGPVGLLSGVSGSTRRLSSDWTNGEGKVVGVRC